MTFGGNTMADSGYEFFDYVPATRTYRTHFFNNLGPDLPDGQGGWIPWMHAKLTRIPSVRP